jgi:cyclophilin family peptidyl-prolyl cis-trans isomerase
MTDRGWPDPAEAATRFSPVRTSLRSLIALSVISIALVGCGSDKTSSTTEAPPAVSDASAVTDSGAGVATTAAAASATACPAADGSAAKTQTFTGEPPTCIDPSKTYVASFETTEGNFDVTLDAKKAPATVNSVVFLARYHYFDDTICHRVIKGFMGQCGDPTATGTGGPGYTLPDELPTEPYKVGTLAMANTGQPHSGGSQFFLITGAQGVGLPPNYATFGQVSNGDEIIGKIEAIANPSDGPPLKELRIKKVTIKES